MPHFFTVVRARPPPRSDATSSRSLAAIRRDTGTDPGRRDRETAPPAIKIVTVPHLQNTATAVLKFNDSTDGRPLPRSPTWCRPAHLPFSL